MGISVRDLSARLRQVRPQGRRLLVALAGAPGSGKSTLSERLAGALGAQVVPMDGFHLDNRLLAKDGTFNRKGAPNTFDVGGLERLLPSLRDEPVVHYPIFDRAADLAIAGAGRIDESCTCVIVEGNYLLLNEEPWTALRDYWDVTILLQSDEDELLRRLTERWLDHGLDLAAAHNRAKTNDMVNAKLVREKSRAADFVL